MGESCVPKIGEGLHVIVSLVEEEEGACMWVLAEVEASSGVSIKGL